MPLVWIAISFIAGIILASLRTLPANIWLSFGLFFIFLFILVRLPEVAKLPAFQSLASSHYYFFILPAFFLFGAWYFQFRQPTIDAFHIAFYNDRDYELLITGSLAEAPDYRDKYTNLRINVKAVEVPVKLEARNANVRMPVTMKKIARRIMLDYTSANIKCIRQ